MKRIEYLASLCKDAKTVADIGCDHGLLLKEVAKLNPLAKLIAIDNKVKPLEAAKRNLKDLKVLFSLSDGISELKKNVDYVVIAGLGGEQIIKILQNGNFSFFEKIIVQPNKNPEKVRKFLTENGFKITCEQIIFENKVYYEIIVFEKGIQLLSDLEIKYGPILINTRSEYFIKKYEAKLLTLPKEKQKQISEELNLKTKVLFKDLADFLDENYPPMLSESWDAPRIGRQFYDDDSEVKKILLSLDITSDTVDEALKIGADTIITHHPFFFYFIEKIDFTNPRTKILQRLIENKINVFSMHTNLDKAIGGVNDALVDTLGFNLKHKLDYLRICDLKKTSCINLAKVIISSLNLSGVKYFDAGKPILRVGVFSGAGGNEQTIAEAVKFNCDCLITSEFKLSAILLAKEYNLSIIEISHGTEEVVFSNVKSVLSQLDIEVVISKQETDPTKFLEK